MQTNITILRVSPQEEILPVEEETHASYARLRRDQPAQSQIRHPFQEGKPMPFVGKLP